MSYLNDPREMAIRPESGVTLEEDNRIETMYHWGAMVLDLCDLPVEEYMKPMTVNVEGYEGGGGDSSSTTKTYALKFYADGRQVGSTYKLEEGAPIPEVDGSKEGYDFSGWADASGNTHTTMPAQALTLYGTNTIKKFTVKFIVDGQELADYEQEIEWNKAVTNVPSSAKTGYSFSGWEPAIPSTIKQNYTFEGTFNINYYTLTLNVSGVSYTSELRYLDIIRYPTNEELGLVGYVVSRWEPYFRQMPDSSITETAVLSAIPYTVKYMIDNGDGSDYQVVTSYTRTYGQTLPSVAKPSQSGYSFTNWSADTQISNNKMPASDVNFYSIKSINNYALSYFIDGEQYGNTDIHAYGEKLTLRAKYEKEGHTVTDWSFSPALDEIPQELGGGYSMPYYNVSATCETSINSYNVVIKHGSEVIYSGSVVYGTEISTLVPAGYSYNGEPSTVPANDMEVSVDINSYDVVIALSGKQPFTLTLEYKSDIKSAVEEYIEENFANELVGHHIETNIPQGATVPTHDVNYTASIVPNQHKVTVSQTSGTTVINLNYGENILDAISGMEVVDEFHYLDGWTINGQPLNANDTMPDEDIVVSPVIKTKESEVTPVISGDSSDSIVIDYGTPVSGIIENIIASASEQTKADLVDPGYAVEWTVNGSAYTPDMVVKEDEVSIEVTITPKPFKLSFMKRGNAASNAGVVASGDTLYKSAIEYPQTPANIEVGGKTYEFKWDEGSVAEGTPMPSSAVTVYGEYVEKPVVNTIYYGKLNWHKFSGFSENSEEFEELEVSDGMPESKQFVFEFVGSERFEELYDLFFNEEELDEDEYYDALDREVALSPVILFPESISKDDYIWKRDLESVNLEFVKTLTIDGNEYSMYYEPFIYHEAPYLVQGYVTRTGIDATIKYENK